MTSLGGGGIMRLFDDDFDFVDCATCATGSACGVTGVLDEAVAALIAVFESYLLGDILG